MNALPCPFCGHAPEVAEMVLTDTCKFAAIECQGCPSHPTGICLNLALEMSSWMRSNETSSVKPKALRAVMDLFKRLSSDWPHFSGDHRFPVPWPDRSLEPKEAYDREDKWEGEYGDLRRNLLEFVRDHATGRAEHPVSTIILNSYKDTPNE